MGGRSRAMEKGVSPRSSDTMLHSSTRTLPGHQDDTSVSACACWRVPADGHKCSWGGEGADGAA